jgi:uncharacterized membrane protein YhdT
MAHRHCTGKTHSPGKRNPKRTGYSSWVLAACCLLFVTYLVLHWDMLRLIIRWAPSE